MSKNIPVSVAKHLSERFQKAVVIICAWDGAEQKLFTTTYGVDAADKIQAAKGGEICARALGMDLSRGETYEDFRKDHCAARERAMSEAIEKYLPSLRRMVAQVPNKPDTFFARMLRDLETAHGRAA